MPPKKTTSSTRGRGHVIEKTLAAEFEPPAYIVTPADDELNVPHVDEGSICPSPPRERSRESSVSSSVSTFSRQADDKGKKKKRAKKNPCKLSIADEDLMLEFTRDNPVVWNVKMTEYRRKDKKDKTCEDQAQLMEKTTLKSWFRSLRDTYTRLDKKKNGDCAAELLRGMSGLSPSSVSLRRSSPNVPSPNKV